MNIPYKIMYEEAKELFNTSIKIEHEIQKIIKLTSVPIAKCITSNVLIGLSIEIYLKTFIAIGHPKGEKKGHDLLKLYQELPIFLKEPVSELFKNRKSDNSFTTLEVAVVFAENEPNIPQTAAPKHDRRDIESCLSEISKTFVESRYFFEGINDVDWKILKYYFEEAKSIAESLDAVLVKYISGHYRGELVTTSSNY